MLARKDGMIGTMARMIEMPVEDAYARLRRPQLADRWDNSSQCSSRRNELVKEPIPVWSELRTSTHVFVAGRDAKFRFFRYYEYRRSVYKCCHSTCGIVGSSFM